jgi:hypothetical protein
MNNSVHAVRVLGRATVPAALALAFAIQGCANPCGDFQASAYRCGTSFNRAKCDQNISKCSSDDVRTIENSAACLQNDSVCKNSSIVDYFKVAACLAPMGSVSQPCQSAF